MKKYIAIFETDNDIISEAIFQTSSLKEARRLAATHKNHTPEINKRKVRTSVYLEKS